MANNVVDDFTGLTAAELTAEGLAKESKQLPDDHNVTVSNFPAVQNIDDQASEFRRIKDKRFLDTEEVRYDIDAVLVSGDIYTGVALDGSSTAATVWNIIRTYFDINGNPSRERIQLGVSWDDRDLGW